MTDTTIQKVPSTVPVGESMTIGAFVLEATRMRVIGEPTFDEWLTIGKTLRWIETGIQWWIGDWLRYGEFAYGEKYAQAVDVTGYQKQTLKNMQYTSEHIEPDRRRTELSFSHHAEVASLPKQKQDEILDKAAADNLTTRETRQLRQAEKGRVTLLDNVRTHIIEIGDPESDSRADFTFWLPELVGKVAPGDILTITVIQEAA